jgi:hypothetical protein
MVLKGFHRFIISLLFIIFLNTSTGLDACPTRNPREQSPLLEMKNVSTGPGMEEIYGEVTAISATEVAIDTGAQKYHLRLASQVQIFCNGLPAVWLALRPVAPEAFFEAKILVNLQNEVVFITGAYWGEICIVKSWRREQDKLFLKLSAADTDDGRTCWRMVESNAKIPRINWLDEDIEIYVLYNFRRNIRAVFFPE